MAAKNQTSICTPMSPFIMCDLTKYPLLLRNSITIWLLITNSHSQSRNPFLWVNHFSEFQHMTWLKKILLLKVLIPASDVVQRAGVALVAVRFSRPPRPGPPIPRWARHTVSLPPLIWWLVNKNIEKVNKLKIQDTKKWNSGWRHLSYDRQGQSLTKHLTPKI